MSIIQLIALASIIATGAAVRDQGTIECDQLVTGNTEDGEHTMGQSSQEHVFAFSVSEERQNIKFDTCTSGFDTYLHVHFANGTLVRSDDDTGSCGLQTVTVDTYAAGEYFLTLEGYSSRSGTYNLRMTCPPVQSIDNLLPEAAVCGGTYSSNTDLAMNLLANPAGDHYYSISLRLPTILTLDACETDYDNYVRIFSSTCTGDCTAADFGQQLYARDDGGCAAGRGHRYNSFSTGPLLEAGDYTILMEGYSRSTGNYNLTITCDEQTTSTRAPDSCFPDEHVDTTTQECVRNTQCVGHDAHSNDVASDCFRLKLNYQSDIEVSATGTPSTTSADYFREVRGLDQSAALNQHVTTPLPVGDSITRCGTEHAGGAAGICTCTGTMHYGMWRGNTHRWSIQHGADGNYRCSNNVFGDPWVGVRKVCYCDTSDTSPGAIHADAVSIESCSMPGKFLAVGTVSSQSTTIRLLERDEFTTDSRGWFDRAATWKKTFGHTGLLATTGVRADNEGADTNDAVAYETLTRTGYFMYARENNGLRIARVTSRNAISVAESALFNKVSDRKAMVPSDQFDPEFGFCRGASWNRPSPTRWASYASAAEAQAACVNTVGCTAVQLSHCGGNRNSADLALRTNCRAVMHFHHQVQAYGQPDVYSGPIACGETRTGDTRNTANIIGNRANDATFSFSVNATSSFEFNTCGSQYDTYVRVLDASGSQVAAGDDNGNCGLQTVLQVANLAAGEYTLVVEGYSNRNGAFTVTMNGANGGACGAGAQTNAPVGTPTNPLPDTSPSVVCYIRQIEAVDAVTSLSAATAEVNPSCPTVNATSVAGCESRCAFPEVDIATACADVISAAVVTHARRTDGIITSSANNADGCPLANGMQPNCFRSCVAACEATVAAPDPSECVRLTSRNYGFEHRAGLRPPIRSHLDRPGFDISNNGFIDDFSQDTFRFVQALLTPATPGLSAVALLQIAAAGQPVAQAEEAAGRVCASEGRTCTCVGTVFYGFGTRWSHLESTSSISCTNGVFGDPYPGRRKSCLCVDADVRAAASAAAAVAADSAIAPLVSIESCEQPGRFVVASNGNLADVGQPDGSSAFATAATFVKRDDEYAPGYFSLEPMAQPGTRVRHQGYRLKLHRPSQDRLFREDASFHELQRAPDFSIEDFQDVETTICEHARSILTCPAGTRMTIDSAWYGRRDMHTCRTSRCPGSGDCNILRGWLNANRYPAPTHCFANAAVSLAGRCDGSTRCEVFASNSVYGDPCGGTLKYMHVSHTCTLAPTALAAAETVLDGQASELDFEYVAANATAVTDRACAPCGRCLPPFFIAAGCSEFAATQCESAVLGVTFVDAADLTAPLPIQDCPTDHYQTDAPTLTSDRECGACRSCGAGQVMADGGECTDTSNRVCTDVETGGDHFSDGVNDAAPGTLLTTCGPGTAVDQAPTTSTDRSCYSCDVGTTFAAGDNSATCTEVTGFCPGDHYESVAPTASTDRQCAPLTDCDDDHYIGTHATDTSDRQCAELTVCVVGEYEAVPEEEDSDRDCQPLRECDYFVADTVEAGSGSPEYEFETTAPTDTSNRVCERLATCADTEWESTAPTDTSDRGCTAHPICDETDEYQTVAASSFNARVCVELDTCHPVEEYQTVAPTNTSNRQCAELHTCDQGNEWESTAPTDTSNRGCTALTRCAVGETYMTIDATFNSDRTCSPVATCEYENEFQSFAPTWDANRRCTALTVCNATEYESIAKTDTTDRSCTPVTECTAGVQYMVSDSTNVLDRVCKTAAVCVSGSYATSNEWQLVDMTTTTDRICRPYTGCGETEYETVEATPTSDRQCQIPTLCDATTEFTTVEFTTTSDRQCGDLAVCNTTTEFESVGPGQYTNRQCEDATVCAEVGTEYQVSDLAEKAQRVCANVTTCDIAGEYELIAPTPTSDRTCGAPTLLFPNDFDTLFPLEDRAVHLASFQDTLTGILRESLRELTPPSLIAVYEGSTLVTIQYENENTTAALGALVASCGIQFTFRGETLDPSPIAAPGSCTPTAPPTNPPDVSIFGSDASTNKKTEDDSASSNFAAIAGACACVALVALVAVTRSRNNQDTSGKPITEDADASSLNPLYSAPTGQFSHDDRGTAAAIAGQAPAEATYDSVNYAKAPQPGDVNYEAYYDAMQKQGKRPQLATYAANDTYANDTYGIADGAAEPRRASNVLESGYTFGTEVSSPEATYDLGASNGAETPAFAIGADYASATTTAEPTYDTGSADERKMSQPTYDMGAAAERKMSEPTYDMGAAANEAPQENMYGIAIDEVSTGADKDMIYDNSPTRLSDDEPLYGIDARRRSMSYGDALGEEAPPPSNIDAVY